MKSGKTLGALCLSRLPGGNSFRSARQGAALFILDGRGVIRCVFAEAPHGRTLNLKRLPKYKLPLAIPPAMPPAARVDMGWGGDPLPATPSPRTPLAALVTWLTLVTRLARIPAGLVA